MRRVHSFTITRIFMLSAMSQTENATDTESFRSLYASNYKLILSDASKNVDNAGNIWTRLTMFNVRGMKFFNIHGILEISLKCPHSLQASNKIRISQCKHSGSSEIVSGHNIIMVSITSFVQFFPSAGIRQVSWKSCNDVTIIRRRKFDTVDVKTSKRQFFAVKLKKKIDFGGSFRINYYTVNTTYDHWPATTIL